jgi:thiol-disulfide isomerase/thioredoxin
MKVQLILSFITLWAGAIGAQNLIFEPERPRAGAEVSITYDPAGTELAGVENIEMAAYFFEDGMPRAEELTPLKEGKKFLVSFTATKETKAVFIKVHDENKGKVDNNEEKGYGILIYDADTEKPVQGAYAAKAQAVNGYSFMVGIKRDTDKALELLKKEFALYPASMENRELLSTYAGLAKRANDEQALAELSRMYESLTILESPGEEQLLLAHDIGRLVADEESQEELAKRLREQYPQGRFSRQELVDAFWRDRDLENRETVFQTFEHEYGHLPQNADVRDGFASQLATAMASQERWDNADEYLAMISSPQRLASTLNSIAWNMAGGGLKGEPKALEKAKAYSWKSLELADPAQVSDLDSKPSYYTEKEWERNRRGVYAMYADTYALILYKLGDAKGALRYQQIAADEDHFKNTENNERYGAYLLAAKGPKAALPWLEERIKEGFATPAMKENFKTIALENYEKEELFERYMLSLEAKALEKLREKILKKLIDQAAPEISLVDMEGQEISLAGLEGKTVVVDFWATWCGPCIQSFPGMQRAVDHFANDEQVVFLFVNTWENAKDKKKNAADFLEKRQYRFRTLMDENNEMVARYGVEGIPTKFIIDPKGRIRFKSVGYDGNEDGLVEELKIMIEIAREQSGMAILTP